MSGRIELAVVLLLLIVAFASTASILALSF